MTWGGLVACGGLGLVVLMERMLRLRERRVVPTAFTAQFVDHLHEGKLDGGQALDHCERNPSPAARVALAAVRRWGRPAGDLERAVAMAHRVETERLRRNVGTLAPRRGPLGAAGHPRHALRPGTGPGIDPAVDRDRAGSSRPPPVAWGPALAAAITPLSTGLIIATLALVAYDGVLTRVEKLAGALDRLGAETIEAIAMSRARRHADRDGPIAPLRQGPQGRGETGPPGQGVDLISAHGNHRAPVRFRSRRLSGNDPMPGLQDARRRGIVVVDRSGKILLGLRGRLAGVGLEWDRPDEVGRQVAERRAVDRVERNTSFGSGRPL